MQVPRAKQDRLHGSVYMVVALVVSKFCPNVRYRAVGRHYFERHVASASVRFSEPSAYKKNCAIMVFLALLDGKGREGCISGTCLDSGIAIKCAKWEKSATISRFCQDMKMQHVGKWEVELFCLAVTLWEIARCKWLDDRACGQDVLK